MSIHEVITESRSMPKHKPVSVVAETANTKTGPVAATWVSQASCPDYCPFHGNGCYAEYGNAGTVTARLNKSRYRSPLRLAQIEADGIDGLPADRDLRLHVVGDCSTPDAAATVAAACRRYMARSDHRVSLGIDLTLALVWGYTHAWRKVPASVWEGVNMLASCQSPDEVEEAWGIGYAVAVVVAEHKSKGMYKWHGIRVLPCPHETKGVQCVDCRLCMDAPRLLRDKIAIGFAAHGSGSAKIRKSLPLLEKGDT